MSHPPHASTASITPSLLPATAPAPSSCPYGLFLSSSIRELAEPKIRQSMLEGMRAGGGSGNAAEEEEEEVVLGDYVQGWGDTIR